MLHGLSRIKTLSLLAFIALPLAAQVPIPPPQFGSGSGGGGGSTSVTINGTANQISLAGTCTSSTSVTCTIALPNAITIGASGAAASLTMGNNTSGLLTLAPVAGVALGAVTASFPANTGTVAELNLAETFTALQTFSSGASVTGLTVSGTNSVTLSNNCVIEYTNPNARFSCPSTEGYYFYDQGRGTNLLMSLLNSSGTGVIAGPVWNGGVIGAAYGGTGVDNSATLTLGTTNQNWATIGTGIVKVTTATGAISDAASTDLSAISGVVLNAANAFTSAGALNLSSSTVADAFRTTVKAGFTAGATGSIGFDSTANNYHGYANGADTIIPGVSGAVTNGHCVEWTVVSSNVLLSDTGSACGSGGGGSAFSSITSGTNTAATMTVGTGASIAVSGTGSVTATTISGGAANDLVYQAGGSTTGFISPVDSAVLITSASGVPSESTTLPNGIAATNMALTTPHVSTIDDANGNPFIASSATASAVDSITITNAAAANPATVTISATGSDTNINLNLAPKGAGTVGVPSNGTDAGGIVVIGNTTAPSIPSNSFGFIGPNSASFTSYVFQPSATAPSGSSLLTAAAVSSNISALTYTALPLTISNGGIGAATAAQNSVFAGPASGGTGPPSFQTAPTISAANMTSGAFNGVIPNLSQDVTTSGSSTVTLNINGGSAQTCTNQWISAISTRGIVTCSNVTYVNGIDQNTTITTGATANLSTAYTVNEEATAGTAITYTLPTASANAAYCVANGNNGSAADTGTIEVATSASGQYIVFTDGTLSASGGYVISGGAARDGACFIGIDTTHWMFYPNSPSGGTWAKH